jgi:hypothetical protein
VIGPKVRTRWVPIGVLLHALRADKTYKLHVPAKVPVGQFWALTLYSENTRRAYDNGGTEIRSVNLDSTMKGL